MTYTPFLGRTALFATLSLAAPSAFAQSANSADLATRRILVEQAEQARQRGDHGRALDLAERAASLQMTPSLRLFITNEQFALRRFVDAMATADVCVREVDRDITVPNRDRIRSECASAQQRARAQIATVVLQVATPRPAGLTVRIGSRAISDVLLGVPIPVDPGELVIESNATGCQAASTTRTVAAGATETIDVALPRCAQTSSDSTTQTAAGPNANSANSANNGAPARDPDDPDPSTQREPPREAPRPQSARISPWPFVGMGVGAVAMGSSGIFFAMRNGAIAPCAVSGGSVVCPDQASLQSALSHAGDAQLFNTLTTATLIGGGVVLAGGVAWLVADRLTSRAPRSSERASRAVRVAAIPGTIFVGGQF
jgi:hypothetical protein